MNGGESAPADHQQMNDHPKEVPQDDEDTDLAFHTPVTVAAAGDGCV